MRRRYWALLALGVLTFTLYFGLATGRGGVLRAQPGPAMTPGAGQGAMPGPSMMQDNLEGLSGDAFDQAFLREMIMHHTMAVMMTRPVAANAAHPELQALAEQIIVDQTREIGQMRGWLKEWYGVEMPDPLTMMAGMPGAGRGPMMGAGGMMAGQRPMMGGMMNGGGTGMGMMHMMAGLPPARLEAVFMSMMIPHHQDAIDMAELAASRAAHDELKALAQSIITTQGAEIATMTGWLRDWYGL